MGSENIICLNEHNSTTRLCHKLVDDAYLDDNGHIKEAYKYSISHPTLKIENSKVVGRPGDRFETMLFLPKCGERKGEGGLRTRGYVKHSYRKIEGKWYIVDYDDTLVEEVELSLESSTLEALPLVSVVTVVYNGDKYLEETIQSVINQTYPNVEYIIIDGGSTDGTLDTIKKYEEYIDYWVSETDKGIYDAMNKGIKLCTGKSVGIINADDYYANETFSKIARLLSQKEADIIHADMKLIDQSTREILEHRTGSEKKLIFGMSISHPTTFVARRVYKEDGLYDTNYQIAADYDFLLKRKLSGRKFLYIPEVLTYMREGGASCESCVLTVYEEKKIKKRALPYFVFFFTEVAKRMRRLIGR